MAVSCQARWTRLPSALSPNGDWDGALTILDGKPVILFDCYSVADCRPPQPSALARPHARAHRSPPPFGARSGDPAIVGVARPADYGDQNLTTWRKDPRNPIAVHGATGPYAGPSTIWKQGATYNMAMQDGHTTARYQTDDATLHNWTVADSNFFRTSSGPTEFFPLPPAAPGTAAPTRAGGGAALPTHVLAGITPPRSV